MYGLRKLRYMQRERQTRNEVRKIMKTKSGGCSLFALRESKWREAEEVKEANKVEE
jgi:hypothetical protein